MTNDRSLSSLYLAKTQPRLQKSAKIENVLIFICTLQIISAFCMTTYFIMSKLTKQTLIFAIKAVNRTHFRDNF